MTVWLVFHPETQNRIEQTLNLLNYDEVVNSEAIPHDEIAQIVRSFPPSRSVPGTSLINSCSWPASTTPSRSI